MTAGARIGAFVAGAAQLALTPAEQHQCFRALLDTLAVALAGQGEAAVRLAHAYVAGDLGRGSALLWGRDVALPPEPAAWVNGIAAHVLDYDDVMAPMRGHISVALIPALLALAPEVDASGADFARAYAVGFEVVARLAQALGSVHYAQGWHSTSSMGVLGATAAAAALLRLDAMQVQHALGLAVAQASGSRQNFGTMAKAFQIGDCGRAAVRSVLLARAGFEAARDALDGPAGYAALYSPGATLAGAFDDLGGAPLALLTIGIEVKKYPCCYATHLALDGILALRQAHDLSLDNVAGIEVLASHRALEALIDGPPGNGLAAKFSMAYVLATALRDGAVRLSSFAGPEALNREVMAFLPRIAVSELPGPVQPRWAELRLRLSDGREISQRIDALRGGAQDPLPDAELIDKAQDCFGFAGLALSAQAFAERLFSLGDQPLQTLLRSLSHPR